MPSPTQAPIVKPPKYRRTMNGETWVRTIAEQLCPDCGEYACLIPIPHAKAEQRTGDDTV
jgi:hypothetical protein